MTHAEIFGVVRSVVCDILPDVDPNEIRIDRALVDLGANSIDRLDVTMGVLEALNLRIPMGEFAGVSNLQGLVEVLHRHVNGGAGA